MRLLFNKESTGSSELKQLTGSYYANNDFSKISTDLTLETEKVIALVSPAVYQLAEDWYWGVENAGDYKDLAEHLQLAIAYAATFRYYQTTIVSHESAGRKLKHDKASETIPWEWMFDRDDQAHERKAFETVDRLISFLNRSGLQQWNDSPAQKATRKLFVNTTKVFHDTYPIDNSGRFYYTVVPFITKIETGEIRKAVGTEKYLDLLSWHQNLENDALPDQPTETDLDNSMLLALIRESVPLMAMSVALQRFSLNVLPYCVVQQFSSMMQTSKASQAATQDLIRNYAESLSRAGSDALEELKLYINRSNPAAGKYQLMPPNPAEQKFFRT